MVKRAAAEEEEAFPRGRAAESTADLAQDSSLALAETPAHPPVKKKTKTKKKNDEVEEEDDDRNSLVTVEETRNANCIRESDMIEGTMVVAAIREVFSEEIVLSLPYNLPGYVAIEQAFEKTLVAEGESLPALDDLYSVGQLVTAVVVALAPAGKRQKIELSLRPSLLNAGLKLETVLPNMWLPTAVSDVQEHVVRLNFGIPGLTGVLKKKECAKAVSQPGSIVQVAVREVKANGTVVCTTNPSDCLSSETIVAEAIKPGVMVHARVEKVLKRKETPQGENTGVVVTFCGIHVGTIHPHHQFGACDESVYLRQSRRVSARVLAVVPNQTGSTIHLTLLPHLVDWSPQASLMEKFRVGSRVKGELVNFCNYYGMSVKVTGEVASGAGTMKKEVTVAGFVPKKRLPEEENGSAKKDAIFDCRVLCYNYLDGTIIVTRKEYDLQEDTLVSGSELAIGQLVTGTVDRICEFGVFVKVSDYVSGLVHIRHLTDIPLTKIKKQFQIGAKLKCRVLRWDENRRKLALTHKKTLLKDDFQLTTFEQARLNMIVTGYVSNVKDYGALVTFYGNVFGLLPSQDMEAEEVPALGMTVKVRLASIKHAKRKLCLSLNLEGGKTPAEFETEDPSERVTHKLPEIGQVISGIRAVLCTQDGVFVRIPAGEEDANDEDDQAGAATVVGFVAKNHLHDDLEAAQAKLDKLAGKIGGIQEADEDIFQRQDAKSVKFGNGAVVLSRRWHPFGKPKPGEEDGQSKKTCVLLTAKPSMLTAAQEDTFVSNFEQLEQFHTYPGYIKEVREFGAFVNVGAWSITGLAGKDKITDRLVENVGEEVVAGQSVRVRVGRVDTDKRQFKADLRSETSVAQPILKEVGAPVKMRVEKVSSTEVVLTGRGMVCGHIHASQFYDLEDVQFGEVKTPLRDIDTSMELAARIINVSSPPEKTEDDSERKMHHIELTVKPSLMKDALPKAKYESAKASWSAIEEGREVLATVRKVTKEYLLLEVGRGFRGSAWAVECSDDKEVVSALPRHFKLGQVVRAVIVTKLTHQKKIQFSLIRPAEVEKGSKVLARMMRMDKIGSRGVAAFFDLAGGKKGWVHVTELFDHWIQNPSKRLLPKSVHDAFVMEMPGKEAWKSNDRYEISLRGTRVLGSKESIEEKRPSHASDLEVGQKVSGYVVNANDKGIFVALGRLLTVRIRLGDVCDEKIEPSVVSKLFPQGSLVKDAIVVSVDKEENRADITLRKHAGKLTLDKLSVGDVVSGRVRHVHKYGFFMRIEGSDIEGLVHVSEISDSASVSLDSFTMGQRIQRAKVLKIEEGKMRLGIKPTYFDDEADEEEENDYDIDMDFFQGKSKDNKEKGSKKKREAKDSDAEEPNAKKAKQEPASIGVNVDDSDDEAPWERAAAAASKSGKPQSQKPGGEAAFVFEEFQAAFEASSDEEGNEDAAESDKEVDEKLTKREKKKAKADEAVETRKREAEVAEGRMSNDPRSVEDYERLLLTEGSTSIVWIRYMAFHLKMSDLEKARQVAERAVKHVGFSEAQERFNVWVAFMNLECTFGTDETADAIFKRASVHNEAKEVYLQLAKIHERNKKTSNAVKSYEVACKKFPGSKQVWIEFLSFLYRQKDLEGGRKTLPKALNMLPRAKHPLVVTKAAILEYNHGSAERGKSIFEGLLDSFPKRTDLWAVYLDAHIRAHTPPQVSAPDLNEIRGLFERCSTMVLKATKMKFFFKRWLDFEKRWGDEESQEKVRVKALAFVESQAA